MMVSSQYRVNRKSAANPYGPVRQGRRGKGHPPRRDHHPKPAAVDAPRAAPDGSR